MLFLILGIVLIFTVIILFSFPQFSPIPYFPSNMKDKDLILEALRTDRTDLIIDLGAGDGAVIFEAANEAYAHQSPTRFIALELNPVLVLILHLRRLFHPHRKNIRIVWGDMFKIKYAKILKNMKHHRMTVYLYISPWLIEQAVSHIGPHAKDARYVSYFYPIKSMRRFESTRKGVHTVFSYSPKS